ncbi:L-glutamate gamma-semialdehyde dehydrogenase [Ancylomarina euxinus]|uniref:L-glutamate gamma-semialdehyde dehydrogenase n=1 Tax=Ancylomarina euxinus TaxID=2283627 RepID=A0A425Y6M4_9BACT|nr:L-glutamate gamma-semialdehyde dehydrogenase [Ancylomarina euxinus]MCZ4694135.1 L-glutamate gamma-semialdehyde dehydrogenase [Ancylomarina euxinus]MUP15801.1 L-glutamate gamma-semialdehyde dehydrogenase [Ancylomarina euxinus]RRG23995.1 L-glutamate gamma-semialdehyde dehydrogenase [Ancylomarina euxinus]
MPKGIYNIPAVTNEPILSYAPGSPERAELQATLKDMRSREIDVPMYIGGEEVRTGNLFAMTPPHDHQHVLGHYHQGEKKHIQMAIDAALAAKPAWEAMAWEHRASIFLKAAELISGPYRQKLNAATMLGQSKNAYQAEIDSACEIADFLRFNVQYMTDIYKQQPISSKGIWNRVEQRPLEGFVFALTPFNFTAIAGNLPTAPAMMGNCIVWKPSKTAVYSAQVLMEVFIKAGVPAGVINLVYVSGPAASEVLFSSPDFAGIHFTGSTGVFQDIWKNIGDNIHKFKSYPRIVGETGGKDYIFMHPTAPAKEVATAITRGAFEYQGQKCSAASRAFIPASKYDEVMAFVHEDLKKIKMGGTEDFTNFVNAVIDEASFNKLASAIDEAKASPDAEVVAGGTYDKSVGYFVAPTIIRALKHDYITMEEELFGPILTIYVYEDDQVDETLDILDKGSMYALTGAIFADCRYAIEKLVKRLTHTAGNFYINDKPTGAVVGQQPFGGGRGSGTNDKAGSMINLLRWVSPRTIKETFVSATDYMYPNFLED